MASRFTTIRVKSRKEFDWLVEHMTQEAYRVRYNWDCWAAMHEASEKYSIELNQTPDFWELTRRAYQDAVVLRLGRLYDPHATATSLGNLLQTMKHNSVPAGSKMPASIAKLDPTELDSDISSVSPDDPIVARLLLLRNEYLAHRGVRHVTKGIFASLPTLERDEVFTLIKRALAILAKYRERLEYEPLLWGHYEVEQLHRFLSLARTALPREDFE